MPVTPGGELVKELREIVEKESVSDMKYKTVESGGRTLNKANSKSQIQLLLLGVTMLTALHVLEEGERVAHV